MPIIIDENITYSDKRIPKWIGKPYNLKYIENEVIVLKKIKQALREINFKRNKFNTEIEKNFVGRNEQIEKFENEINNLDNWVPTYIIAYNYFEGIGRRTFLKNVLRKSNLIDYTYDPVIITVDSKESIENFIYKLNSISKIDEISEYDFSEESLESKIEIAKKIVKEFISFKELLFIIDDGGIVLPNNEIVEWYQKIVNDSDFTNQLTFCLISKYRPNEIKLKKEKKSLTYRLPELSSLETKNLFLKLLNIYQLNNITKENKQFFIDKLNGIPSQIIFAVNQIEIDLMSAKKNINEIIEFTDNFSSTVLNHIKLNNPIAYQIIILLSKEEIISFDILNKVFGDNDVTYSSIQLLYDLSVFNFVLSGYEYLKLNPILSDYINRSKLTLDSKYQSEFSKVSKELLEQDLDDVLKNDYSEFMLTIQNMLEDGRKIPKKYFIPSLIIKNIIKKYDKGEYDDVIRICLELLAKTNYDEQIIWETTYRLTLAYARTKNDKFFDYISYFRNESNNLDYYFLLGFYHRHANKKDRALEYYYKALGVYPEHSRSKREIVNILLSQGKYEEALNLAKANYEKKRTNIFHIHSYFISIIRRRKKITSEEKTILTELIESIKRSSDIKAEDITRCMEGEFEYYVKNNLTRAIDILEEAFKLNDNKIYPQKSLLEIYKRRGMKDAYDKLKKNKDIDED